MRYGVPVILVLVAVVHALPLVGVLGAGKLAQLYGTPVQDAGVELLLRHRAVLFGLLAASAAAAFAGVQLRRPWRHAAQALMWLLLAAIAWYYWPAGAGLR